MCGGWEGGWLLKDWGGGDGDAEVGCEGEREGEEPGYASEAHIVVDIEVGECCEAAWVRFVML